MAITKEQVEKKFIDSGVALGKKYATGKYLENRKLTTKVTSPAEVIAYTMTTLQNDGADVDLVIDDKEKEWRIDYKYSDGSKDSISGPIIVTEAGTTTKKKVENTVVFRELNGMPVEVPVSVAEAKKTADMIKTIKKTDDFKGAKRTSWVQTQARKQIQRFQQPKTRSEAIEAKKEGQLSSDYVNAKRAYQQNIGPYVDGLAKKIESQAKKQGREAGQITTEIYGLLGRIVAAESEAAAQAVANSILNSPDSEYVELSKIKGALKLVLNDAMTLKKSGYRFSYNTTSESSASTMKVSAVQARKIVDPIGLSPEFVRRQHDPAEMRIPSNKWKQQQKKSGRQMFHRNPIIASEAWGVLRPGRESPELLSRGNKVIPYDALVLGAEVTEEEAHRIGKSVREGASVAAEDFMEVVSTVRQEFEEEFSEKFAYRVAEKEYNQRTKGRRGKKKPPAFKNISEDEKNRYIKDALIRTLKNKYKINIDNAVVDYDDIEGQYIVSGVGTKYAKDAQRLTSMYGIRSAANKATSEQISSIVGQRNGQNVTFIKEKEGINARNIGTHASQDIQTLFVRAAESADGLKGLMDRIDSFVKNGTYKYADNSVVDFSEIAKIFQDFFKLSKGGSYVITEGLLLDKLQNATDPEIFSKLLLFTDVLQNPTADTQFYAPRFGDDGRLNVARTNNRRYFYDALSATNQFYYGAYDKYGAVSMTSGADSIDRLAAIAGLSENDAKKISDLLRPSEAEQAELEELRKRDAEARRRTYQTAEKDFDASKLIGDEDYVIIGRGSGDNIIDISTIQKAVRDENGRITNESEMLVGRLNEYIEKKFGNLSDEERKEKLDKLQIVIDLGDNLGETTTYVDERGNSKTYFAGGTHAFLRQGVSSNKNIFDNAQQLINTLNIEGVNKKYLNEQFIEFLASMSNDVNYKEGRSYQEVWKQKQPRSMYGAAASFSTKDILSDKEYESASDSEKLISDIASYGAAVSANTAQEMLEDRAAFSIDQLRDMLRTFSGKNLKKTIKGKDGKLKSVELNRAETIQEILKYLTIGSEEFNDAASRGALGEGLSAFIGRLPFMNGLDIKALGNLFIDPSFRDSGLKLSVGLSKLMNADFDGDKIAAALIALSDMGDTPEDIETFKKSFSKLTATSKAIAGKMAKITKQAEEQEEDLGFSAKESGNLRKELEMAATIASRVDKGKTGIFSNYASEIRERMKNAGIDETGGIRDETSALRAVRAMLTRGLLETNEQNVISSKKTILRMAKIQAGGKELTNEDEINKYYSMAINEISKFNEQWRTGKLTLSEFLDKLTELGVTGSGKDGESFIEGRVMQQILLAAEEMVDKVSGGDKEKAKNLWHQMFGENVRRYEELGDSEKYLYGQGLTRDIFEKSFSAVADQLGTTADDLLKEAIWHTNTPEKRRIDPESESAAYHLTRDEQGKIHYVDSSALKPEFYQMVEKSAKDAKKAVDEERVAEEKKIVVAGKEARAISALTVSYGGLASEVEGLKEIGASKGWNTVTGFASQLAPFGRMGTDAGYGNISSRLDRIFANQNDTDEFISMSQEERARRFGYGDDVESFEKERSTVLSSIYGTAAHSISQILSEASQKYGKDIMDLHSLTEVGDNDLINKYLDAIEIQRKKMGILGFSDDEIRKQQFKTMYSGERNFESLLNLVGGEKGKHFINLGKPEQSIIGENALGEKLYGQIDATYISKYLDQSGAEKSIFNVVDYKNLSGEIKPENVIQVLTYIALLRQLKAEVQKMKSEGMSESDAIDEIVRKNTNASGNQRYSKEFIQNILSSNDFAGKLISTSKGVTTQYSIRDPGTMLMSKILSGNLSNEDLKTLMSFVTKNVSTTSQLQATEKYKEVIGEEATAEETKKREEESAKKTEEDKKELKKQYITLLREEESLLEKIDKLNHQIKETQGRGEDVTALKKDLSVYRRAKNAVRRKMRASEFSVLKDENGNIIDNDILSEQEIQGAKRKSKKSLLGVGDAEDTLKAFEKYATKRMKLESEIEQAQLKASTTVGNEKKAWENVVALKQQSLDKTKEIYNILEQQARKKVGDQRVDEITEAVKEQSAILSAQKFAGNRGNRTIFDVVKSDIQRATMRITDFGLAARVLNTARKDIQQVYQNILKLNEAMTNLRVITGTGQAQAMEMMRTYNSLAKELGTTTQAVAQSAAEWLRQGYSVSETNKLIQSSTYLSRLGFMDMAQSVTALTSVMKGFRVEASNSMEIVDKLTQLDAKYATTAGDIATALSRTSAVAREAGLDLDQTAAALTTMIDISQQDASSVGNAFKTILARYGNVKAGVFSKMMGDSEDIDETNSAINDTEKVLNAIGIQVRSSSNDIRDFDEVFAELAEKYQYLSDVERAAVTTALGGVRQRNLLNILLNNYDQYIDAIEESQKAVGSAERKNQAYLKSTAYQISRMSAAWEDFTQKLDADEGVVKFFELMSNLIEKIDRILPWILTYVASIRAYKLPQLIPKLLGFMGFTTNEEGKTDVKGGFSRWGKFFTGQASGTQEQQSRKALILTIRDAIKAIRNNTAAKMGKKPPFGPSSGGGGRATGMTLSGKKVYQDSNGVWRYLNHRVVGDKDLQGIQTPSDKKEMSAADQARLRRNQNIARTVATGVTAGVSIGLSTEGDTTDKVTKGLIGGVLGVGAGALNFVPGAGPILSTIATLLVPVLTDLIGDNLLKIIKQNEVARADRVKIANAQLEALNKIAASTSDVINLSKDEQSLWDANDWKTYNDYMSSIKKAESGSIAFANALKKAKVNLEDYTAENLRLIEATRIRVEADQKYAAGEEDRYKLLKEIEENRNKLEGDEAETARNLITSARAEIAEYEKERRKSYLEAAFVETTSGMTPGEIGAASLERVVMQIAENLSAKYPEIFGDDQLLTDESWSDIVSFLKEQSGYESLINQTTRDVFEMKAAKSAVDNMLEGKNSPYDVKSLQKLARQKDFEAIRKLLENTVDVNDFIDKLMRVDDDAIAMIAHNMGMTIEDFNIANEKGAFDFLTKGDAINGAEKLADKMNALDDIIVDLAADGALTAENINKIVQNYKFLLRGPDGQIGIENVLGNLATQLAAGADSPMMRAYVGRRIKELSEDKDAWALYTSSKQFEDRFKKDTEKYNNLLVAGSYSKALNILGNDDEAKQEFWDIASELAGIPDLFKQTQEKLIEFKVQEYDNEIQNLASIKDALADINKQREREIDLIKAKESLENARKEFKSVYRAGIGWTYEVDQAAVESAQERVDELERQQTQEDLQYQIDILNQQKELLENISKNEELQNLQEIAKNFAGQVTANDLLAAILGTNVTKLREKAEAGIRSEAAGRVDDSTKEANTKAFESAKEDYEEALQTLKDYYTNNEAILKDTANPLYGTTKDEYARLYADAQTKRAAVLAASEAANRVYVAEMINRPDPNKYAEAPVGSVNVGVGTGTFGAWLNPDFMDKAEGTSLAKHMVGEHRSKYDKYVIYSYNPQTKMWEATQLATGTTLEEAQGKMNDYDILINDWEYGGWNDRAVFKVDDQLYWVNANQGDIRELQLDTFSLSTEDVKYVPDPSTMSLTLYRKDPKTGEWVQYYGGDGMATNASGTLSFSGGRTLINENGLESIITPQGTITSLPAKSGILPADLTKNLWTLGEVAPNLIARLSGSNFQTNNATSTTDNSINIDKLDATFNTTQDFDGRQFITDLKNQVLLTAYNH